MAEQYVVVAGNIADGLRFYGPFTDANVAGDWASEEVDDTWITVKLEQVYEEGLRQERDALTRVLDACGGRNIEVAEEIDHINEELGDR